MGCKPFSSFVSNVSSSIEESAILHPYASYKEKFWCSSLERGAEVGQFSATLTKIGFPLPVSAGPGLHAAPPPGFHQKITSSFMQVHRSCRIIFIQQYSKSTRAGKSRENQIEKLKSSVLSEEILSCLLLELGWNHNCDGHGNRFLHLQCPHLHCCLHR